MVELRKRKWNSQYCATLWQGNYHKVAAPYFYYYVHSSAVERRLDNLAYVGLSGRSSPQYRAKSEVCDQQVLKGYPLTHFIHKVIHDDLD